MLRNFPPQFAVAGSAGYQVPLVVPGQYNIKTLDGFCNSTAGAIRFLQFHDIAAVGSLTTGVSVPLYSLQVLGQDGFTWQWLEDTHLLKFPALVNGLLVILSSTNAVWTSTADTVDIELALEEWEFQTVATTSTAGDTTTARKNLQVWADASGPKSLRKLEITNAQNATTTRIQIFAKDSPSAGNVPVIDLPIGTSASAVTSLVLDFGNNGGVSPFAQTAAGVQNDGCTVAGSTTAGSLTAPAGNDLTIKATYV